jgi:hypothetical protein
MYDIFNNCIVYNFLPCITNNAVHGHVTRSSTNLHITTLSSLDKHSFIYNSVAWNKCHICLRNLPGYDDASIGREFHNKSLPPRRLPPSHCLLDLEKTVGSIALFCQSNPITHNVQWFTSILQLYQRLTTER